MYITAGIVTHKKNPSRAMSSQKEVPPVKKPITHLGSVPIYHPRLAVDVATDFRFEAHALGDAEAKTQVGGRHTRVTRSHVGEAATIVRNFHTAHLKVPGQDTQRQRPQRLCGSFAR